MKPTGFIWLLPLLLTTASLQAQPREIEEIVVTGSAIGDLRLTVPNGAGGRLGLSALETAASVDMITRDEIALKGDYDALAAITRSAGMSASASPGNGGTSVSMRGFNGHGSTTNTYDGTRLYISAGTVTFPADTWTVERVEVLRGAGSVINGVGAIGATINYIPKSPSPGEPGFEALVAAGSFDRRRLALGGSADLNDDWSLRLDGVAQDSDSQVDRNTEQRRILAGSLLYQPGADFSMRLSVDHAAVDEDSPYFGTPLVDGRAGSSLRRQNYNFADGFMHFDDLWVRLRTDWRLRPGLSLRNDSYQISAEREWQNLETYRWNPDTGLIDRDGSSYYGIVHDQRQLGTRSDLLIESGLFGRDNRLSIGFDVNRIDLDYHNNWSEGIFYAGNSVPVFGWQPDTLADAAIPMALDYSTDTTQYGLFFDNVLTLAPRWQLVLGGRYDDLDYARQDHAVGGNPASRFDTDFSEFTWRAGLVFRPVEQMSLYAQYSRASDPVSSPVSMSAGFRDFDLTRGRQFEMGIKQQRRDGRAEYTLAWFHIEKTDLLTRLPGEMESRQIGGQSSRGLEATLRASLTDRLNLDLNAAWVDAEFDEFWLEDSSLAGNMPRNVPEVTANAWLTWQPLPSLSIGGGLRHVGSRYTNDRNTTELPAYTVLDARIGWQIDARTLLTLRARNLNDESDYVLSQYGTDQWIFGDPRNFELSVRYSL